MDKSGTWACVIAGIMMAAGGYLAYDGYSGTPRVDNDGKLTTAKTDLDSGIKKAREMEDRLTKFSSALGYSDLRNWLGREKYFEKWTKEISNDGEVAKKLADYGVDTTKTLSEPEIALAWAIKMQAASDPKSVYQGLLSTDDGIKSELKADVDALYEEFKKKATAETYRGLPVFGPEQKEQQRQHNQGRFVFLDSRTALAGTRVAVLGAIDRKLGGGPSVLNNTALLGRAQTISGAHQVWVVSDSPGQMVSRALPKNADAQASNFARIFSSMRNTAIALDLTGGLDLRASGVCGTAQDAKTLADAARGMVALGRLSASSEDPSLLTVFDGVEVQERDAELNIAVKIDQQSLDKLLDQTGSRRRERVKLD